MNKTVLAFAVGLVSTCALVFGLRADDMKAPVPPPIKDCEVHQFVQVQPPKPKRMRGAKKTPVHKVLKALRDGTLTLHATNPKIPASVTMVPGTLSMLGNDQYGDCVTAEACSSHEAYSVYVGLPEIVITDSAAVAWAQAHGVLDGADLLQVTQMMQQDGITDSTGVNRKPGTSSTVDYTNEANLQSALAVGPVQFGIDANALPGGAGNASGWYAFGGTPQQFNNEDHCVGCWGYGPAATLFKALNTPVPSNAPNTTCYLFYTWATIGVVDHAWIMSTAGEAYLRTPTTLGLTPGPTPVPPAPVPPNPTPGPTTLGTLTLPGSLAAGSYSLVPQGSVVVPPGGAALSPATVQALQADGWTFSPTKRGR